MPELEHLLLRCSWAWRGAGREPGVTPGSSAGAASRDACLPETGWRTRRTLVCPTLVMPSALCSCESRNPNPLGLIFAPVNRAAHNPRVCPRPSASLLQKRQEVGVAGGCCGRRRGAYHLGRVHTGAAIFCGCWLWLGFSACNPSEQINCSKVGSECTEAEGATLV